MKIGCFNPHPASRLDAFLPVYVKMYDSASVSILTQPSGWMQLDGLAILDLVSILTQPIGWVQPNLPLNYEGRLFQSSPNLLAGCKSAQKVSILTQPRGWVQLSQHEQVAI